MLPLFEHYPGLAASLAHLELGVFPTPVHPLEKLSGHLGRTELYIKRDDLSGTLYGGNKIRKLEFLLADARKQGYRRVLTSGAAGSNHALATALYSRQCGIDCTLMLFTQPQDPAIAGQLLADYSTGAAMFHDAAYPEHLRHLEVQMAHHAAEEGKLPYHIPAGGSSAVGAVGFVNAAFELADQIRQGLLPQPAAVFVTLGTMGTAAGLLLGLAAAGLTTTLVTVRVVPEAVAGRSKLEALFNQVNTLLSDADPSFPRVDFNAAAFEIKDDYFGTGYGVPTVPCREAINIFGAADAIALDPVYTGKTAAAFLDAVRIGQFGSRPLLFWHTKSARPAPQTTVDYHSLPPEFHTYFQE